MITPPSKFYTQKQLDNVVKLRDGLKVKSTDYLKDFLTKIHAYPIDKFRLALLAISFELSDRGIAPRWQGITNAPATEDQYATIAANQSDGIVIDLYWLSIEFPKHKGKNGRWHQLWSSSFDLELAASIACVDRHRSSKVKDLNLSEYQQLGCVCLIGTQARKKLGKASYAAQDKRLKESNYRNEKTSEEIEEHARLITRCAKLADCSPQKTADVYRWVTGEKVSRQNMGKLITKYKISSGKKLIGKIPPETHPVWSEGCLLQI